MVTGTPVTTTFGYTGDKLTSFGGTTIAYNAMGCPVSYNGKNYVWANGKLSRIYCGNSTQTGTLYEDSSYTYNGFGQRVRKYYAYDPNPGSTSDYSYTYDTAYQYDHFGRLIREYCTERYIGGNVTTREFVFLYDESGMIGVAYSLNGATAQSYFFRRNLLGDVIGIYDTSGNQVAGYAYDAWGNCTVIYGAGTDLAKSNPIRYRGYYYDRDTGLYYCNARYYSPKWRRFISPDDIAYLAPESVNGLNLYCYCNNDPVNYCDPSGRVAFSTLLLTALVCGVVAAGANAVGQVVFDGRTLQTMEWERVAIAGIAGFAAGLIPGTGFASIVGQAFVSAVVDNTLSALWLGDDFSAGGIIVDTLASVVTGLAIKGITHFSTKLTSRIFDKAPNYSQYQHYYRKKSYNYSRQEVYDLMRKHIKFKRYADKFIDSLLDFSFSFATYPV